MSAQEEIVYIVFGALCGFGHFLGVLEYTPCGWEGTVKYRTLETLRQLVSNLFRMLSLKMALGIV